MSLVFRLVRRSRINNPTHQPTYIATKWKKTPCACVSAILTFLDILMVCVCVGGGYQISGLHHFLFGQGVGRAQILRQYKKMNLESLRFNFLLIYIDKVNIGQKSSYLKRGRKNWKKSQSNPAHCRKRTLNFLIVFNRLLMGKHSTGCVTPEKCYYFVGIQRSILF